MSADPTLLGAAAVVAGALGIARSVALSQRGIDNGVFERLMIRLATEGKLDRAEKLLAAMPKAAYAQMLSAGFARLRQNADELPEPLLRSEMLGAMRRVRDAMDSELARGRLVDLIQLGLAAGPVAFTLYGGAVMPPWGWGGVIVGILSLLVVIRKRRSIAAVNPERADGILDAVFAARRRSPEEQDAYRAPAPPPPVVPFPGGAVRVNAYRDGELVAQTELAPSDILKLGRLEAAGHSLKLESPEVSRVHAVLERTSDGISVIDLGSDTGTRVNGERVSRTSLREGDRIEIGPFVVLLGDAAPPPPTRRTDDPTCPMCKKTVVVPLTPVPEEWSRIGLEADHCLSCGHVGLKKSPRATS